MKKLMKQKIGSLYITYDGLSDPLGQSQVIPYLNDLANKDIKIVILSYEKKEALKKTNLLFDIEQILSKNGIEWNQLRYHRIPRLLATLYDVMHGYVKCLILINKHRLNVVHARGYISAFIAFALKGSCGIKFVFDMRGFWVEEKVDAGVWRKDSFIYKIAKLLEKMMLNSSDQIVVLTEKAKSTLINSFGTPLKKIAVIATCVDLKRFKPPPGDKRPFLQNRVVVLYSGSAGTFYGIREAVSFFQKLYNREQRSFFLALINNQKDIVENMLETCRLPQETYKVLSLSYAEVPAWLQEADVSLIFYHRYNSFVGCCPTKFAESLACGVPVIVNRDIGDCDDIIKKEKIGFVLDDFSDFEYGKVIDKLLPALKERDVLHNRCRNIAEKLFSLNIGVDKYLKVYNNLL